MGDDQEIYNRLRQPEYTGANRCVPCTVANLLIAAIFSLVVSLQSVELGGSVFGLSVLIIYVRGYLIPGTPALTERLLPDRVHDRFGTDVTPRETTSTNSWDAIERHKDRKENRVKAEEYLLKTNVLDQVETETYARTSVFVEHMHDEFTSFGDQPLWQENDPTEIGTKYIADLLGVNSDEIHSKTEPYPAVRVAARVRQWPSEQALRADIASHRALESLDDEWLDVPLDQRLEILTALRSYNETCPCGGELSETTETIDSCCRSGNVIALVCTTCSEPLLERDPSTTDWFSLKDV